KRVVTQGPSTESGDPKELDFQWQQCGLLEFQGKAAPARSWGGPGAEPVLTFPTVSAEIRREGESKSRPVRSTERPLKWLEPGGYEVVLTCPGRVTLTRTIQIEPGKVTGLDYELPLLPGTRNVHIEVHTGPGPLPWLRTGEDEFWTIALIAYMSGSPSQAWVADFSSSIGCGVGREDFQSLVWEKRGWDNVAIATFYDVPPGDVEYIISSHPDAFHLGESQLPNGDLSVVMTMLGNLKGPGWGFQESDENGAVRLPALPFDSRVVYAMTDDHESVMLYEFEGRSLRVPNRLAGPPARWAYCASGRVPVIGTASDFLPNGKGWNMANVEFKKGYRSEILVVDAAGKPKAGASILADGVEVGSTNSKGIGLVELAAAPRLLEVQSGDLFWTARLSSLSLSPFTTPWFRVQLGSPTKEEGVTTPKDS
ncbi:MAG: hypothetical protein P1V35_07865, partial [Planctomycetota bacterium]|nr:hypothetical protein [Planctomycetota bacterium]